MKVRFKVNAEWEEEVPDEALKEIAESDGLEGDEPNEDEINNALNFWLESRTDALRDDPTDKIPDTDINVSHEIIS